MIVFISHLQYHDDLMKMGGIRVHLIRVIVQIEGGHAVLWCRYVQYGV